MQVVGKEKDDLGDRRPGSNTNPRTCEGKTEGEYWYGHAKDGMKDVQRTRVRIHYGSDNEGP